MKPNPGRRLGLPMLHVPSPYVKKYLPFPRASNSQMHLLLYLDQFDILLVLWKFKLFQRNSFKIAYVFRNCCYSAIVFDVCVKGKTVCQCNVKGKTVCKCCRLDCGQFHCMWQVRFAAMYKYARNPQRMAIYNPVLHQHQKIA